jgi:hypothetical protein
VAHFVAKVGFNPHSPDGTSILSAQSPTLT